MRGRTVLQRIGIAAVMSLVLAACGGDNGEETTPPGSPTGGETSSSAPAEPLRVAMLLPGKANDQGYSQLGATALERVKTEQGAETTLAESIPVPQAVEAFRQFARQDYDVVFGWGGQFQDAATEVATAFPDVYFVVMDGVGGNGSNLSSISLAYEQWLYLIGYADAKVTKSGELGFIAGPCFDVTARELHGYEQGVEAADTGASVNVVSVNSFDDAAGAKEAALALVQEGVDVIHTALSAGSFGVYEAVQGTETLVSAPFFDQNQFAPDNIYTSDIRDTTVVGDVAMGKVVDGTFDGEPIRISISEDEQGLAPFNGLAPDSLFDEVKGLQAQIASGGVAVDADGSCPF